MRGKELYDITHVHDGWEKLHSDYSFPEKKTRILPAEYQANDARALENVLIVQDDLLSQEELESFRHDLMEAERLGGSASMRLMRNPESNRFDVGETGGLLRLSEDHHERLRGALALVINRIWKDKYNTLLPRPDMATHVDTWINTGPLPEQPGRYHFSHYDCDEYLEFSKGLFRFPIYASVFYLGISEDLDGGGLWVPEMDQVIQPKTNRAVIFDASKIHSVLPSSAPCRRRFQRQVMVMNIWDYETRNEKIEHDKGVLGYTADRTDELIWQP